MSRKILFVSQHYWPESFRSTDIAHFFTEKGCTVDVLCGIPNYPKGKFYEGYSLFRNRKQVRDGITIKRTLEIPRGNNSNFRILINYLSFPFFSLFHVPRLLTKKYDKIFLFQTSPVMMSIAGILVGKIKKTETTMYVLDLWPENLFSVINIKNPILRKLVTRVSHWHYRKADKLVVLSKKMRERIIEVTKVDSSRVIVLPQACEKIYEEEIIDKTLVNKFAGSFNVVFAGNISPAQSFETIIGAAKQLKESGINDIRWIIVGDGMSKQIIEQKIQDKGLEDIFIFEGQKPVEDVPKYTHIADVLVGCLVKSDLLEATIPGKVMSYIAAGKPIALAMDGEVQTLINKEIRCGFASPTEDEDSLAESIRTLYNMSPKERIALGERSKSYYFKHFEREITLGKLYDFMFAKKKVR